MNGRRHLVTGGLGFLGKHVVRRILREEPDATIFVVDVREDHAFDARADRVVVLRTPVQMIGAAARKPFARVWHLACPASPIEYRKDPIGTLDTCSRGTEAALRVAEEDGARILVASTSEVYGDPFTTPQDESFRGWVDPTGPRSMYDEGKRYAEAVSVAFSRVRGVDLRMPRIFNTYGPGMRLDDGRMVPELAVAALTGREVRVHGDGSQTRSLCYVDDLISGLFALMNSEDPAARGKPVNLGSEDERPVREWARMITSIAKGPVPSCVDQPDPQDPHRRRPNLLRARSLGIPGAIVPADIGLTRTIADIELRILDGEAGPEAKAAMLKRNSGPLATSAP